MKKLILTILFTLVLSGGASAKETMLVCEYQETYFRNWDQGQFGETIENESATKVGYFNIIQNSDQNFAFETNIRLPNLRNMKDEKFESTVDEKYYLFQVQKDNLYISIALDRYSGILTTQTGHTDDNGKYLIQNFYSCKKGEQKF